MFTSFRQSMAWVHTWFGLTLGYVLMACFFFGALSVFDREIDRWAIPETRYAPQPMPSFDKMLLPIIAKLHPNEKTYAAEVSQYIDVKKTPIPPRESLKAEELFFYTTHRDPVLLMGVGFTVPSPVDPDAENHAHGFTTIDPRSGLEIPDNKLKVGSEFFYPMHYSLHLNWKDLGYWIVGLAALIMLVALVSGVIIHRKVLRELFTFRPNKHTQRSTLDLHNLTGVVALPFHFFFAFTGVVIFAGIYLPIGDTMLRPLSLAQKAVEASTTGLPAKAAGIAAPLAPMDPMVAEAKRRWAERGMAGEVGYVQVHHLNDKNSYVSIFRAGSDRVALVGQGVHFEGATGRVIREDPSDSAVKSVNEFMTGLHLQHFEHWLLRWLYVFGGLAGCICIATGFIFFVEKRKKQHAKESALGSRIVDALAVTTVTGMVLATVAMLAANRALPENMPNRADWQMYVFWSAWALSLAHALWRDAPVSLARMSPAWREQCYAIATTCIAAALLNWVSTGDHLLKTLGLTAHSRYWPVAGVDLSLLVCAGLATYAARKLLQREQSQGSLHTPQPASERAVGVDETPTPLGASASSIAS